MSKVGIKAGNDINLAGTQVSAGDSIALRAGNDINVGAVKDSSIEGHYGLDKKRLEDESVIGSNLNAKNDVTLVADNNITIKGSGIIADQGMVGIQAGNNVTITTENELHKDENDRKSAGGGAISKEKAHQIDKVIVNQSIGSSIYGNDVIIKAGNDLDIHGSQVLANEDVALRAGGNINITASKDTVDEYHMKSIKTTGFSSAGLSVSYGTESTKNTDWSHQEYYTGSTVGAINGDVSAIAGKDVNIVGSDVIAMKGDVYLEGENVNITSAVANGDYHNRFEYKKTGITVGLGGKLIDPLLQANDYAKVSNGAQTDELKYTAAAYAAWKAYDAWKDMKSMMDPGGMKGAISINVSIGSQSMKSRQDMDVTTNYGSTVSAGGDVTIVARGKDQGEGLPKVGGDININASSVSGGNDVTLDANRNINITAGQDTQNMSGSMSSSGWSFGGGWGIGGGGFTGLDFSISGGKGKSGGSKVENIESTVSAGDTLTMKSGGDTNIIGSQVYGDSVKMDVGGDLNIVSLQDTDNYKEKNKNWNMGFSDVKNTTTTKGDIKTTSITGGISGGISKQNIDSTFSSVDDQAGIYAGKGGFDINVGGNTDLKGGVISSGADAEKNKLSTDTLTYTDLKNEADWEAKTTGANINTGKGVENKDKGLTPNLAGSDGDDSSTTKSAISPGTIEVRSDPDKDLSDLSRDPSKANDPLKPIFDKDKILEKQQAAALFGEMGFDLVGNIIKTKDLGSDSPEAIALHALVGGIMAEINGGKFGDGLTTAAINKILVNELHKSGLVDPEDMRIISALTGFLLNDHEGAGIADSATANNYRKYGFTIGIPEELKIVGLSISILEYTDDDGRNGQGFIVVEGQGELSEEQFSKLIKFIKKVHAYGGVLRGEGNSVPGASFEDFYKDNLKSYGALQVTTAGYAVQVGVDSSGGFHADVVQNNSIIAGGGAFRFNFSLGHTDHLKTPDALEAAHQYQKNQGER